MSERHKVFTALGLLLVTVLYGLWQWNVHSTLTIEAAQLQTEITGLTSESSQLAKDYQEVKKEVSIARATSAQELTQVFPAQENLSDLTRLLDTFALKNNFESNPFFISQVSYQAAMPSSDGLSNIVPVSLSIVTSKKNLSKFLEYVENSGSLEGQVRLMSIENLTLDYPEEFGGTYDVHVDLNAYFAQGL